MRKIEFDDGTASDKLLLKSQKNEIFAAITEIGLNPLQFEWRREAVENIYLQRYDISCIYYRPANFYFKFDYDDEGVRLSVFRPGEQRMKQSKQAENWNQQLNDVKKWLAFVKREVEIPDLWEQLKGYAPQETFIGTAEISNAPFSSSEAENIIASLDKLQAQIEKNFNLQEEQHVFVERQFDYLKDAVKRLGRKDWIHTSIGVMVGIAVNLALSPEKAKLLWDLVRSCFAHILPLPAP